MMKRLWNPLWPQTAGISMSFEPMGGGGEGPDFADPEEGAEDQELAEPEESDSYEESLEESFEESNEASQSEFQKEDQENSYGRDFERDAAYAELRRRAQAAERELEEVRQLREGEFQLNAKGKVNPYTGDVIETMEDYTEYLMEYAREQAISEGSIDDYVDQLIEYHPAVLEAKRIQEEASIRADVELTNQFNHDFDFIKKVNPEIKTLVDIENHVDYDVFTALLKNGKSLKESYEKSSKRKQDRSNTKAHLQTVSGGSGQSAYEKPPREIYSMYKRLNPKATDEQILKHWRKGRKRNER